MNIVEFCNKQKIFMVKLSQRYVAGKGIYQIHEKRDYEAGGPEQVIQIKYLYFFCN